MLERAPLKPRRVPPDISGDQLTLLTTWLCHCIVSLGKLPIPPKKTLPPPPGRHRRPCMPMLEVAAQYAKMQ